MYAKYLQIPYKEVQQALRPYKSMQPITTDLVLNALRLWNIQDIPIHPFHTTHLKKQPTTSLNWAMEKLKYRNPKAHALLEERFIHGKEISVICERENVAEATILYRQRKAIETLTGILMELEEQVLYDWQQNVLSVVPAATYQKLIGIDDKIQAAITAVPNNVIVAIDGLGGIGKTALADYTVRQLFATSEPFSRVAWITAKQTPQNTTIESRLPALTPMMIVSELAEQWEISAQSRLVAQREVERILDNDANLIIIDNLETHTDYQTLLPMLQKRRHHTRFMLTTRRRLLHEHVCSISMNELSINDSFALMRFEANASGFSELANASNETLQSIYDAVGGNPLAIKLVVSQLRFHSLHRVLEGMKSRAVVNGRNVFDYIYELTWQTVGDEHKMALLALSQAGAVGFTFEHLETVSQIPEGKLYDVLEYLIELALVDSDGDVHHRRYRLHQLTATFINNTFG